MTTMQSLFTTPTKEEAQAAAVAINDFMAHWDAGIEATTGQPVLRKSPFDGRHVRRLEWIPAAPYLGQGVRMWVATFVCEEGQEELGEMLFDVSECRARFTLTIGFKIEEPQTPDSL